MGGPLFRGLFFTGTDTGVGKTFVASAVGRWLREQGRTVRVCKPVATGAAWVDGRRLSDDAQRLAEAVGQTDELDAITPWAFPEPVAPPVAARLHRTTLTLPSLAATVRKQAQPGGILLVEGVGGLLCPLTENETVADLVAELQLPLVIVARRSLGTLNHALMTVEIAHWRRLAVAGVVINETEPPRDLAAQTNADELRRRLAVPLLAVVPHHVEAPSAALAGVSAVDWWETARERGVDEAWKP